MKLKNNRSLYITAGPLVFGLEALSLLISNESENSASGPLQRINEGKARETENKWAIVNIRLKYHNWPEIEKLKALMATGLQYRWL